MHRARVAPDEFNTLVLHVTLGAGVGKGPGDVALLHDLEVGCADFLTFDLQVPPVLRQDVAVEPLFDGDADGVPGREVRARRLKDDADGRHTHTHTHTHTRTSTTNERNNNNNETANICQRDDNQQVVI